jgi:hypothetical protein
LVLVRDFLRAVAEEISKYKLNLVGVEEVRWDGGGTEPTGEYRGCPDEGYPKKLYI